MTEPAVGVAVGPDGVDHAGAIGSVEQHGGEAALDEPSLAIEERPGSNEGFFGPAVRQELVA